MSTDENEKTDEITSLVSPESEERESQPLLVTVQVPKWAKDSDGREKGFGLARIGKSELDAHPEIVGGAELTPGLRKEWEERGVFIHIKSVDGMGRGQSLDGAQIVPLSIRLNSDKGKYEIARAETLDRYQQRQALELQRKEATRQREREKAEREQRTDAEAQLYYEELNREGYSLSEDELQTISRDAVQANTVWESGNSQRLATTADKIEKAHRDARYRQSSNEFATLYSDFKSEAERIALEVGGRIVAEDVSLSVVIEADAGAEWEKAYNIARSVDLWLAENGLLEQYPGSDSERNPLHLGRFTGAKIESFLRQTTDAMWVDHIMVQEPEKPVSCITVWKRDANGLVDKRAEAEADRAILNSASKWMEIASAAKLYKEGIVAEEERLEKEKEEAGEKIKWLISKVPPARANPGQTIEGEWIGLKAISSARNDHNGSIGGAFVNYSCIVDIPGCVPLDVEKPERWAKDLRKEAHALWNAWEKSQPAEAVVPGETSEEAVWRLEGFTYKISCLPEIEGMQWKIGHHEAHAYLNASDETLIPELPNIPGEWSKDKLSFYTHDLIMSGVGMEDTRVGLVVLRKGRVDRGYIGEVVGSPHYKIQDFLKAHSDADPRLIRLTWQPVIPVETE